MKLNWSRLSRKSSAVCLPMVADAPAATSVTSVPADEFLSFSLGNCEYGVEISRVQEIRGYDLVTRVEDAPDFLQGVIDLRGARVPVIDLRNAQLAAQPEPHHRRHGAFGEFSVMIVLNVSAQLIGMVVDGVADVMPFDRDHIAPATQPRAELIDRFISGVGELGERMLMLVDVDRLIGSLDLPRLALLAERPH